MRFMTYGLIGLALLATSCQSREYNVHQDSTLTSAPNPAGWRSLAESSLDFFIEKAWNEEKQVFFSDIDFDGKVTSSSVHLIAASRMLYGLSWASELVKSKRELYLSRAAKFLNFYKKNMMTSDADGIYFHQSFDANEGKAVLSDTLIVNEQAYGLNGLVAYYAITQDQDVLKTIRLAYQAFVKRFADKKNGGFFDRFDLKTHSATKTKSYNSTVYVATSFLLDLANADAQNRQHYLSALFMLGDLVSTKFVDRSSGWIFENFKDDWTPEWRDWQKQVVQVNGKDETVSIGVAGHNTQAAWLLLRLSKLKEASSVRAKTYQEAAAFILNELIKKSHHNVNDNVHGPIDFARGGFYDVFQRERDETMWHTNKPWWQQCVGIMAYDLAVKMGSVDHQIGQDIVDKASSFFFKFFQDKTRGGEYSEVDSAGQPLADKPKGHAGKSTYHTVELARFMALGQ